MCVCVCVQINITVNFYAIYSSGFIIIIMYACDIVNINVLTQAHAKHDTMRHCVRASKLCEHIFISFCEDL